MSWVQFVKFEDGKAQIDTNAIDRVITDIGMDFDGKYEAFIAGPSGNQYLNSNLMRMFSRGQQERRMRDSIFQMDILGHSAVNNVWVEVDKKPSVFRVAENNAIHSCTLVHNRTCDQGRSVARLYFGTNRELGDWMESRTGSLGLLPCPCCMGRDADVQIARDLESMLYDFWAIGYPPRTGKKYPLDIAPSKIGRLKRQKYRESTRGIRADAALGLGFFLLWAFIAIALNAFFHCAAGQQFISRFSSLFSFSLGQLASVFEKTFLWPWRYPAFGREILEGRAAAFGTDACFWLSSICSLAAVRLITGYIDCFAIQKKRRTFGNVVGDILHMLISCVTCFFLPIIYAPVLLLKNAVKLADGFMAVCHLAIPFEKYRGAYLYGMYKELNSK